jgi:hypothetical protein
LWCGMGVVGSRRISEFGCCCESNVSTNVTSVWRACKLQLIEQTVPYQGTAYIYTLQHRITFIILDAHAEYYLV